MFLGWVNGWVAVEGVTFAGAAVCAPNWRESWGNETKVGVEGGGSLAEED